MSDIIVNLSGLKKSFSSGIGNSLQILNGIDLKVNSGESIAITGPSGCGKSTLLNIIGTLEPADSGKVEIDGTDISGLDEKSLANIRLSKIGFVFQKHHLLPQLTAMENVLLPTLKSSQGPSTERAKELLNKVGLSERMTHRPGQLSGGECQRVALCRALINKPAILLADEPTGALDGSSTQNMSELLIKLNQEENLTLLTVTHSLEVAGMMGTHYKLENGLLDKA